MEDGLDEGREVAIGVPTVGEKRVVFLNGVDPEKRAQPSGGEATP